MVATLIATQPSTIVTRNVETIEQRARRLYTAAQRSAQNAPCGQYDVALEGIRWLISTHHFGDAVFAAKKLLRQLDDVYGEAALQSAREMALHLMKVGAHRRECCKEDFAVLAVSVGLPGFEAPFMIEGKNALMLARSIEQRMQPARPTVTTQSDAKSGEARKAAKAAQDRQLRNAMKGKGGSQPAFTHAPKKGAKSGKK